MKKRTRTTTYSVLIAFVLLIVSVSNVFAAAPLDFHIEVEEFVGTSGETFYALGSLAIGLGIVLAYSGFPQIYTLTLFYGLLGVAILISGGLVLRRYLTENPPQSRYDNE